MIKEITEKEFDEAVSKGTVLVDFWAPWCNSCKMLSKILDSIAIAKPEVTVLKVNAEQEKSLAQRFDVSTLPTMLIYKDGELQNALTGVVARGKLNSLLKD